MEIDTQFKQAPEPTDIIWENRGKNDKTIYRNGSLATIYVTFMLLAFFIATFSLRKTTSVVSEIFPEVEC